MQKVLCSIISLNQKVIDKQWQCAETTSSLHTGGASKVLKDANISVKSATNPSSGFALKVIKTIIFQIPLNLCALIKNGVQPVNICRQMHSVLFSTWKWKKGIWFAESRWAPHLRYELHIWDMCHNPISGRLTSNLFKLEEASGGLGWSNRAPCHGNKKLCWTGQEPSEEHQVELTSSLHFSYYFSGALKPRNLPHALRIIGNIDFCEWLQTGGSWKGFTLQQNPLNIYILRAEVQ